ncbi:fibronectin type III domain-containing protein, partial [Candidatus Woesearchaeota archaeon]|nr:fibronectin type III domain-containing protein [Candidatus Woesearchaeota archaeon]
MSKKIWQPIAIFCICLIINVNFYAADALKITHDPEEQVIVTARTAQVTWTTDEEADSELNYGTNRTELTKKEKKTEQSLTHLILLENLLPATTYYYELISTMANGTSIKDNYSNRFYSFTTIDVSKLFLNVSIQSKYNTNVVDIPGTTKKNSFVWLYINPEPERICTTQYDYSATSGSNGQFTLSNVRLGAQNNIVICVRDTAGDTLSQSFDVTVDTEAPLVNFTLPDTSLETSLKLDGTVNEKVRIFYMVNNDSAEKTAGPGAFTFTLSLKDNITNDVIVTFSDDAGNLVEYKEGIFVDKEDPMIIEQNIAELTPSYSQEVVVRGKVNKPNIDVMVFVNDRAKILTAED